MAARNNPNELHLTRLYDAPVALVWDAWTDPDQVAKWWGPRGFTITTHSKDLRPGGHWTYTMHGPDGTNYENKTLYYEVEPRAKLVYDHGGHDDRPPLFRVTVLFREEGDRTRMEMTMTLSTPEAAQEMSQFIKQAGGNATWDRLAEYLASQGGEERFVIQRSFHAPLDVMFQMWTDPEHLARWLPPTGFKMQFLRADIRTGGSSLFLMTNGSGVTFHGRAQYLEMQPPERLSYTQEFCDEQENLCRHPLAPVWPATLLTSVQLAAEGPDQTRVTVTSQPYGPTSPEELAAFLQARGGMTMGWTGSFDKLEEKLASMGQLV